jgi:hypothetical protein
METLYLEKNELKLKIHSEMERLSSASFGKIGTPISMKDVCFIKTPISQKQEKLRQNADNSFFDQAFFKKITAFFFKKS